MTTSDQPLWTLDERVIKVITLGLGVASLFLSLGTGRFLSVAAQRKIDISILIIVSALCAISLLLMLRSWTSTLIHLRTLKKDWFWFIYCTIFCGAKPPYDEPWVQEWGLSYCHPTCREPYLKEKVSHIIVDDEYKDQKLIVSPTTYPYETKGHTYQLEGANTEMNDQYEKSYPGAREYIRRLMLLVNEKLAPWKCTEGEFKPHATVPWAIDPRGTAAGVEGSVAVNVGKPDDMYENTLDRFKEIFTSSELKGVIDTHMSWLRETTRKIVVSPCGFFVSRAGLSFTSLGSLSILMIYKSSTNPVVYVYDHDKKTVKLQRSYEIPKNQIQKVVTGLSLWACSPTGAIHTDVTVLKGGSKLETHCYTLEESIEYCMYETGAIKLAAIHGTGELFDVSAK